MSIAGVLSLSQRQVERLIENGVLTRNEDNNLVISESVAAYVQYKTKPVTTDSDGTVIDFNEQRARKTKLEADALQLKNEIETGKYLELSTVSADIEDAVTVVSRILNDLKLNISRHAPEMPNRALDLIEKECAKALTAVCDLDEGYSEATRQYVQSVARTNPEA